MHTLNLEVKQRQQCKIIIFTPNKYMVIRMNKFSQQYATRELPLLTVKLKSLKIMDHQAAAIFQEVIAHIIGLVEDVEYEDRIQFSPAMRRLVNYLRAQLLVLYSISQRVPTRTISDALSQYTDPISPSHSSPESPSPSHSSPESPPPSYSPPPGSPRREE